MAGGMAEAYNDDVAEKKAQVAQINAIKREWLFKTGMQKMETRRAAVKESRARISEAVGFGFDKDAAAVLEASGELTPVLTRLSKLRDDPEKRFSKTGIKKMSKAILDNVPEDRVSAAVKYAFDSGAVEDFDAEKLIDVVFSTSNVEESLQEGFDMVAGIPTGSGIPRISATGVNLGSLTPMTAEKEQKARNLIKERLGDALGGTRTDNGGYQWENPVAANAIIEKSLDYYVRKISDPLLEVDLTDVSSEISTTIRDLVQTGVGLNEIATNFEFGVGYTPPTSPPGSDLNVNDSSGGPTIVPPSVTVDEIIQKNSLSGKQ
tara:strand:- start:5638 stop:6597 length:960 start_codon:yes stop_codon:yes gene_type:complete